MLGCFCISRTAISSPFFSRPSTGILSRSLGDLGIRVGDVIAACRDDSDQKINFREFIRVLAHFRPINKNKPNTLNGRDEKLKCECVSWVNLASLMMEMSTVLLIVVPPRCSRIHDVRSQQERLHHTRRVQSHPQHDGRREYHRRTGAI